MELHNTDFEDHNPDVEDHNPDFEDHNPDFEDHNAGFEVHNEDLNTETVPWRRKNISLPKNSFETSLENVKTALNALKVKEDSRVKFDEISQCLRATQSDDKNSISRLHLAVDSARVRIECKISDWASSVQDGQAMFECDLRLDAILAATGHGLNKDASKHDAYNKAVQKLISQHIPAIECGLRGLELQASETPFPHLDEKDNGIAMEKSVSEEDEVDGDQDFINIQHGRKRNYGQRFLEDFIIWIHKHKKNYHSLTVLKQSAHFCKMSLEFEFHELGSGVRCRVYVEGQFVEEHLGATKENAKTVASQKALKKLYGICWTIVFKKPDADSHYKTVTPEELIGDTVKFDKPIPSNNIGNILLQKMGWAGGGLGKEGNKGITEPVSITSTVTNRQGFGLSAQSGIKDDFKPKVRSILMDYARCPDETDLVFSSQFSNEEQAIIMGESFKLGLNTCCKGGKRKRRTVISRRWKASELLYHVKCSGGSTARYDLLPPGTMNESLVFKQTEAIAELVSTACEVDGELLGLVPGPDDMNDFRLKVRTFLMNYIASSDQNDLVFSPQFGMKERKIISRESRKFGLCCNGNGRADEGRLMIVSRKRKASQSVSPVTCSCGSTAKRDLLPSGPEASVLHRTGGPCIHQPTEAGDGDSQGNELLQEMDWTGGGVGKEDKKGPTKGMWGSGMIDHEWLGLMPGKLIEDEFKLKVRTFLTDYARSSNQNELFFSPQFSGREKAIISSECRKQGLKWIGQGKGYNRFMIVSRKQEINHDLLPSTAGSASSVFIQTAGICICNSQPTTEPEVGDNQGNEPLMVKEMDWTGGGVGKQGEKGPAKGIRSTRMITREELGPMPGQVLKDEFKPKVEILLQDYARFSNQNDLFFSPQLSGTEPAVIGSMGGMGNEGKKGSGKGMCGSGMIDHEGLGLIPGKVIEDDFKLKVRTFLTDYARSSNQNDVVFSPQFIGRQRSIITNECRKHGLKVSGQGKGDNRILIVGRIKRTINQSISPATCSDGSTAKHDPLSSETGSENFGTFYSQLKNGECGDSPAGIELFSEMGLTGGSVGKVGETLPAEQAPVGCVIEPETLGLIPAQILEGHFRSKVRTIIMDYARSSDQNDLFFSPSFTDIEGKIIQSESQKNGLKFNCPGKGDKRFITVSRKREKNPAVSHVTCGGESVAKRGLLPSRPETSVLHQTGSPCIHQPTEDGDGDRQGNELLQEMDWTGGGVGKEGKKGSAKGMTGTGMIDHEELGLTPGKVHVTNNEFKHKVRTFLRDYARSSNQTDLKFSPQLSTKQRIIVNAESSKLGLKSKAEGNRKSEQRFITVSRKQKTKQPVRHVTFRGELLSSRNGCERSSLPQSIGPCDPKSEEAVAGETCSQGNDRLQKIGCDRGVGNVGNKGVMESMALIRVNNPEELENIAGQVSNAEFTQKIKTILINYTRSSGQDTLTFSPKITKKERKIIRAECHNMGLKTKTGDKRCVTVYHKQNLQTL